MSPDACLGLVRIETKKFQIPDLRFHRSASGCGLLAFRGRGRIFRMHLRGARV